MDGKSIRVRRVYLKSEAFGTGYLIPDGYWAGMGLEKIFRGYGMGMVLDDTRPAYPKLCTNLPEIYTRTLLSFILFPLTIVR
ncbi:hypothetical protein Hanom_Chr08g00750241 [Helianthus anomalus]